MQDKSLGEQPFLLHVSPRLETTDLPDRYPYNIPAIRHMGKLCFGANVTFFVGENGSGKSTLLEAIAMASGMNAEGGSVNFNFSTRSSESGFYRHIRLAKGFRKPRTGFFLRAESLFTLATEIENLDSEPGLGPPVIKSYGGVSLHEQSHGESILTIIKHRFGRNGLYFLDEPESALSPSRQLALLRMMHDLCSAGSQLVVATHSPIILSYPNATIYELSSSGVALASYDNLEHVVLSRAFLANPAQFLQQLLTDD